MNSLNLKEKMQQLCKLKDWRNLVDMIDDGYKGMYVILRIIRDSDCPVGTCDVAKQMNVSTARVATALNTLQNKGFVVRSCSEKDARKVDLRLTAEGEQALSQRENTIFQTVAPMFEKLTDKEKTDFFEILHKLLK